MKKIIFALLKGVGAFVPQTVPELIYTSLPKFIKRPVNALLMSFIPEYIKIGSVEIALNNEDPVVCGALTLGVYEKCESKLIQEKLKPGMTFVDLGANVGLYTALAASIVGKEGRVYAFEPDTDNFSFLNKTVRKNGFTNTKCLKTAISDHNGTGRLFFSKENFGDHRIFGSENERGSTEIELMTLDHFVETNSISNVDFIKMDIQGAEGLAIKGMEVVLKNNPHMQIFAEFWPEGISKTGESPKDFLKTLVRHVHGREFANLYCTR
ncbi:MAG: FkbM family methyltransferase [Parcubacteria group bacterium Athens0416_74]|nr:MAG: FkbM family methyltransferase [Parcubacteria group bacterium Athens0416_74]